MIKNKSLSSRIFMIVNGIILSLLALSCLYPLWYTFCISVSSKEAVDAGQVLLFPIGFNFGSYKLIMRDSAFFSSVMVSLKRVVLGTLLSMTCMILMAYPLSKTKRHFKARNICMWILVFVMLFNGGTIPWYMTVRYYGLIDTIWSLILSGSLPVFNIFLIVSFFRQLPSDLEEAAIMDGAGPWTILWRIFVPCSIPVLATVCLFVSVGYWNEYFQGLLFINTPANYPLQTYIKQIVVKIAADVSYTTEQYQEMTQNSNRALDAAKVFISMIPMLMVYPFIQRYFVTGITLGAVKG